MISTREGFGQGLVELGEKNEQIVVLCADLTDSTKTSPFRERFPERFIQVGIAEQNMANIAVGLSLQGKIPFLATYAVFSPGRNWDQIRISGCYNRANVKYAGAHSGLSVGPDGATHQALEDIALTRVLPRMTVLVPCDAEETRKVTHAAADINGPVYFRYARAATAAFTTAQTPFKIGRAQVFRDGDDVAIIGAGPIVHTALVVADRLVEKNISCRVINSPSIKPLDGETIERAARECKALVTCEEHQVTGGLGGAIAEYTSKTFPVPINFIGMQDSFGESGQPNELLKKYKMDAEAIEAAVLAVVKRKRT
ncbi:MAG: transketolase [Candidatus Andersenbacteria bacterium RIFCSPHIGHO2_12_FULL_46_9]|nr:MAG: transketolase [Candidatus Andersenbacteria bacterium RIFCSPHIGHO2_02_FULL_46_16]OGY35977.1 MAG: transketolase [Candidatus Andersenbacteria bacterium RIFCSPHIGHO2_12_FULL_46_9]OGY42843.1 MAG: transketolase [Candidatus Andersenbacteria bacterium RIFCSPLOWO2_12_FULL_45_8]